MVMTRVGGGDRFNHVPFDLAEGVPELLPKPGQPAWTRRLTLGGVVIDEVDVVLVFEREGLIEHFGERIESCLSAFGYFGGHW